MNNFGFIRVAAASPKIRLADMTANAAEIIRMIEEAQENEVSILVFPHMCLTGYTCGDILRRSSIMEQTKAAIEDIASHMSDMNITAIIGAPSSEGYHMESSAYILNGGEIWGEVRRSDDYPRYFKIGDAKVAIVFDDDSINPGSVVSESILGGANIIANLGSTSSIPGKWEIKKQSMQMQSLRMRSAYIYSGPGIGESTGDNVFSGDTLICENGQVLAEGLRYELESQLSIADVDLEKITNERLNTPAFNSKMAEMMYDSVEEIEVCTETYSNFENTLYREIDSIPFIPKGCDVERSKKLEETVEIQVMGLVSRLAHINCESAIIGVSGGLDSTLAILVTALAFDKLGWSRERIIGVTMPGFGTTVRTKDNASDLMEALGITIREISIKEACEKHFEDIGHNKECHDITYENSQARERTQILMDISNQCKGIVIGTGDLSELALGWATYNGDHMSMYGVNASIPKTLVMHLVGWIAENKFQEGEASGRPVKDILYDIIDTPISPELLPADEKGEISQVTEDLVGPYELHDFFLYNFIKHGYSPAKILFLADRAFSSLYDTEVIKKWLKTFIWRFFSQQFKRSCLPDGPCASEVSLSPRGGWAMPSDAKCRIFLEELD